MELLYPLPETGADPATDGSVTVLVSRKVLQADEKAFMDALKVRLRDFDRFPGTAGSRIFRRQSGDGVEFSILQHFVSQAGHDAWLTSPQFARWREEVAPPVPTPGHVHRYSGMESFFVSAKAPDAPLRWKMVLLLLLVVYPLSLAISTWGAPVLASLPVLLGTLLTSVFMVWLMTYVLVPILTRVFQSWLQPKGSPKN